MTLNRRSVLWLSGAVLGGGLAGCLTSSPRSNGAEPTGSTSSPTAAPTESSTPSTTASTTEFSPQIPELTFSAEVLRQPSSEAPARIAATLSNAGSEPVELGMGPALLFSDDAAALDWPLDIVLDPETYVGPWSDPVQTDDGCWRFPEDGEQSIQSIVEYYEIAPSQSMREEYDVYTSSHASTCLPEGTYRFQDQGTGGGEAYGPTLTLVLEIDENQQLSARTEEPLI